MSTKHFKRLGLLSAGLGILVGMAVQAVASPPKHLTSTNPGSLLQKATRVFPLESPGEGDYQGGGVGRLWLSSHELLHFNRRGQLYRYDLATQSETLLAALTHQVKTSPAYLYFLDTSPDGQSVIWGMSSNNPFFVAPVDGSRREQWPGNQGLSEPYWCADSHHWIEFQFGGTPEKIRWTTILVHNTDTPDHSETIAAIPPGLQGLEIVAAPSADLVIARTPDSHKMGPSTRITTPDGHVGFTFTDQVTYRKTQAISVWSLHQAQPLHRWTIALPGYAAEAEVSPKGDRVAWLLTSSASEPPAVLGNPSASLWVGNLDGSQMHKVGSVEGGERPLQVCWLPSGDQLSFEYQGAIWTVPAD